MNNHSIVIVEDEAIVAEDLAGKVRQLGYEIAATAMTGEEAIQLVEQHRPSLVLMDIRLAGAMDGIEAAQAIHAAYRIPVLFLTAHADEKTVERARQAGAFGYLLKPFDERDLRIQIEMALYKSTAERRLHESRKQLTGINQILQAALTCATEEELGEKCLEIIKKITQSQFGFIGKITNEHLEHLSLCPAAKRACAIDEQIPHGVFKIHGLYGQVILEGKSLFTNDLVHHPGSIGLPANHVSLHSFLGVPLLDQEQVVGLLAVGNREQGYSQREQDMLEALAPSMVEAFARKRSEEKLQKSAAALRLAHEQLLESQQATLTMMHDAVAARRQAEEVSVALHHEIAVRKQAEEDLRQLNNELEQRVEQRTLELQKTQLQYLHAEKLSAIGKLSASIAHEFNNPLQGILAVLRGLKRRARMEDEDKELLDEAIEEGERIKGLIRNLQEFNRPTSGQSSMMDVHKTLDSVLLLYTNEFKSRRISVVRDYAEGLPNILAISDQIKQVVLNMFTNAAAACCVPGGVITVKTWQDDAERVAVAIQDTGIGIEQSDLDRIFQPFYTTKPEVKGSGLGLSVSHGIVKNHGGEIRVESRPGAGATFTILLPIKGTDRGEETHNGEVFSAPPAASTRNLEE
jgi:signal transduction histidine kinase/DNA-binding NarL/FixJ family response regulator